MNPKKGIVVLNPTSGRRRHVETVSRRASEQGYRVRETEEPGDAITIARDAARDGVPRIVAAGGDGTVNEVVRGIAQAGAFDSVTVGVIPVGTGNNFARNLGITGIDDAFAVLERGDRRRIDLGQVNGHLFANSCIAGLTAEASANTSAEMKTRFGTFAYVINTLRELTTFEGLQLTVSIWEESRTTPAWAGDAEIVLIGNGRRFTIQGEDQANMEDGLLDVLIVEDASTIDLMGERVSERLFGRRAEHTVRLQAPNLEITVRGSDVVNFSLDGEILPFEELSVGVRPRVMRIAVGDGYRPDPDRQ